MWFGGCLKARFVPSAVTQRAVPKGKRLPKRSPGPILNLISLPGGILAIHRLKCSLRPSVPDFSIRAPCSCWVRERPFCRAEETSLVLLSMCGSLEQNHCAVRIQHAEVEHVTGVQCRAPKNVGVAGSCLLVAAPSGFQLLPSVRIRGSNSRCR